MPLACHHAHYIGILPKLQVVYARVFEYFIFLLIPYKLVISFLPNITSSKTLIFIA